MRKSPWSQPLPFFWLGSTNVDAMEIVGTKSSVTLGTFALAGVIARLHTLEAENMETLGKHSILFPHVAARTGQARLQRQGESEQPERVIIQMACIHKQTTT